MDSPLEQIQDGRLNKDTRAALTLIEVCVAILIATLLIAVLLSALRVNAPGGARVFQSRLPGGAQVSSVYGWSPSSERGAMPETSWPQEARRISRLRSATRGQPALFTNFSTLEADK